MIMQNPQNPIFCPWALRGPKAPPREDRINEDHDFGQMVAVRSILSWSDLTETRSHIRSFQTPTFSNSSNPSSTEIVSLLFSKVSAVLGFPRGIQISSSKMMLIIVFFDVVFCLLFPLFSFDVLRFYVVFCDVHRCHLFVFF